MISQFNQKMSRFFSNNWTPVLTKQTGVQDEIICFPARTYISTGVIVANLKISESWERADFICQMKRDRPVAQGELAGQGEMYANSGVIMNHQHNGGRALDVIF